MGKFGNVAGTHGIPANKTKSKRRAAKPRVNEDSGNSAKRRKLAPDSMDRPARHGVRECQDKAAVRRELTRIILRLAHEATQLGMQIDDAFEVQPYISKLPPDHPKNQRRFRARLRLLQRAFSCVSKAVHLFPELYADVDLLNRLSAMGQLAAQHGKNSSRPS